MRYKIDFGITFLISIFIMIFGQVWQLLDSQPEAFPYGNEIYHFLSVIFYVLSELAIGTATAILFYFMLQYLEKNKTIDMYTNYRTPIISVLYFHMKILKDIRPFYDLNNRTIGHGDFFTINEIPTLINVYDSLDEERTFLKWELKAFFINADFQRLDRIEKT